MNSPAARPRRPVARRLFLNLLVLGGMLAAAAIGLEIAAEHRHNLKALDERFAAIEDGYLPSIRENAWLDDRERLAILVQGIQSMPWIDHVVVRSPAGAVLAAQGVAPADPITRTWALSRPYGGKDYPLGRLEATASRDKLQAAILERLAEDAGSFFGVIVVLATLMTLQVRRSVTARLGKVAAYARRLGEQAPHQAPPPPMADDAADDEFTDLAHTLGRMRDELAGAYDAISASELRYRELFTSSPVCLWEEDFSAVREAVVAAAPGVADEDFPAWLEANPDFVREAAGLVRIIDVNDAAIRMHRAAGRDDLTARLAAIFTPDSYPAFRTQLAAIRRGGTDVMAESQLRALDGEVFEVVLHWHVLPQHRDTLARVIVSAENVGELKAARRSIELTLERLAQSNAELERFTYVASHDLQEPVRQVVSFAQLISRRLKADGRLDSETAEDLEFLMAAATRMQGQVAGLLEYTRAGQGLGERFGAVSLAEVLAHAKRQLAAQIEMARAEITAAGLPSVYGDREQLIQLFRHLLDNALKFRHPVRTLAVAVTAQRDGAAWRIAIADNGIGIEPGYADGVFEVFRRLHGPGLYPGAGVGLAICRRIVERHGGDIAIDTSRPADQGTTVMFTLPAA